MTTTENLERFRTLFARVRDAYGIMTAGGAITERKPFTDDLIQMHVDGEIRVGSLFLDQEGMADQLVFDDDENRPDLVKRILAILDELGIEAYPETSKSKGHHIRAHFQPAPAADLRKIGAYVARLAGVPDIEVFPKQDRRGDLDPKTGLPGLGNFMWLPLHGKSLETGRTAIVDRSNGLDPVPDQWEAVQSIPINSLETLANALATVEEAEPPPRPLTAAPPVGNAILQRTRNSTLASLAGSMRRRGMSPRAIEAALLEENAAKCTPPLPDDEVRVIAASIARYEPAAPIAKPTTERKPLFDDVGRILREGVQAPIWLVYLLIERGLILLFGPSGSGKSFMAMYLAYILATGGTFFGRKVENGPVIYFNGEGRFGAFRRNAALEAHHGVNIPENSLFMSRRAVTLCAAAVPEIKTEIEAVIETAGRPPVLIVVDTLNRHILGDENATKDMGEFVNAVDELAAEYGCSIVVVHHTGHAADAKDRARGSSVLGAAVDTSIRCNNGMLSWTKCKDSELPESIPFSLMQIQVGIDDDGEPITSAVIVPGEDNSRPPSGDNLQKGERLALETLIEVSVRGEVRDGRRWARLDEWREEFVKRYWADNIKAKQKAHLRSREELVSKGIISINNDFYSVVRPGDVSRVEDLAMIDPIVRSIRKTGDRRHLETIGDIVSAQMETDGDTPCKGVSLSPVPPLKKGGKRS